MPNMPFDGASFIRPCLPSNLTCKPRYGICPRCSAIPDRDGIRFSRRKFLATILNVSLVLTQATSSIAEDSSLRGSPQGPTSQTTSQSNPPSPKRGKRQTWGYDTHNGPSVWSKLSPDWQVAETGQLQSPIPLSYKTAMLENPNSSDRPRLQTTTSKLAGRLRPLPNAAQPSLQLEPYIPPPPPFVGDVPPLDIYKSPPSPAVIFAEDSAYELRGIHFHAGRTEHEIGGWSGALETHFRFERRDRAFAQREEEDGKDEDGDKVEFDQGITEDDAKKASQVRKEQKQVEKDRKAPQYLNLAILGEKAETSAPWLSSFLKNFRMRSADEVSVVVSLDMGDVIPSFETCDIYAYTGSFTTPPCTEGVQWLVLSSRMPVAEDDVNEILRMQGGENVRPMQNTNDRRVSRFPALKSNTDEE